MIFVLNPISAGPPPLPQGFSDKNLTCQGSRDHSFVGSYIEFSSSTFLTFIFSSN